MKGLKIVVLALVLCGAFQAQAQSAGRVQIQADPRIEELLRLRVENNDDGRKVDGFVIQIYYGRKQQATRVLEAFREAYPMEHVEMEYDTPDYKVFVGAYLTQQQAQTIRVLSCGRKRSRCTIGEPEQPSGAQRSVKGARGGFGK